jgi:hypothetical protein
MDAPKTARLTPKSPTGVKRRRQSRVSLELEGLSLDLQLKRVKLARELDRFHVEARE